MANGFAEGGFQTGIAKAREEKSVQADRKSQQKFREDQLALGVRKQDSAERKQSLDEANGIIDSMIELVRAEGVRSGGDSKQALQLGETLQPTADRVFSDRGLVSSSRFALGIQGIVSEEAKGRAEARGKLSRAATTLGKKEEDVSDAERRQLAGLDFSAATKVGEVEQDLQNGLITKEWADFLKKQIRLDDSAGGPFEGKGFRASASNHTLSIASKVRQGVPLTQDEQASYALAYNFLTAPSTSVDASGRRTTITPPIPPAHLVPPPDQLSAAASSATTSPQPGGAATAEERTRSLPRPTDGSVTITTPGGGTVTTTQPQRRSPETAGKTAMITAAIDAAKAVKAGLIEADDSINRVRLGLMTTDIPFLGKGIPATTGRALRAKFEDGAAAKLRLETGAAAPAHELQNIVDRFLPSVLDDDATIKDKLARMEAFFAQSLELTDKALFDRLTKQGGGPQEAPPDLPPDIQEALKSEPGAEFVKIDEDGTFRFKRPNGTEFGLR